MAPGSAGRCPRRKSGSRFSGEGWSTSIAAGSPGYNYIDRALLLYAVKRVSLMAHAPASSAAAVLVLLALGWVAPAYAHGVERVRRELTEQGYTQLEFQRTKPPFKLDACRDGQRYHLHVDFYGKFTEETLLGPCDGEEANAPEASTIAKPNDVAKPASPAAKAAPARSTTTKPATRELCSRYFAEIGKTLQVPCE